MTSSTVTRVHEVQADGGCRFPRKDSVVGVHVAASIPENCDPLGFHELPMVELNVHYLDHVDRPGAALPGDWHGWGRARFPLAMLSRVRTTWLAHELGTGPLRVAGSGGAATAVALAAVLARFEDREPVALFDSWCDDKWSWRAELNRTWPDGNPDGAVQWWQGARAGDL